MTTPNPETRQILQLHLRTSRVALGTLLVMAVVLAFVLLLSIRNVLVAVFLSILIATALRPLVSWLVARGVARIIAVGTALTLLVSLIVGIVAAIGPFLVNQASMLVAELPSLYVTVRTALVTSSYASLREIGNNLDTSFTLPEVFSTQMLFQISSWLPQIGYGLFIAISMFLFAYYWLLYRDRSISGFLLLVPLTFREEVEQFWFDVEDRIGGFIRGQIVLSVSVGVVSLIAYWIVGVPYPLLLGLIATIGEFVPFVGPILTTAVAAALGLTISPSIALYAILAGLVVQQLENIILIPRIMNRVAGVNPAVTLLALVGFAALFGVAGALLAVPLTAVAQLVFNRWLETRSQAAALEKLQGRSRIDLLRYQVQMLAQDVRQHMLNKEDVVNHHTDEVEEDMEYVLGRLDSILYQSQRERT